MYIKKRHFVPNRYIYTQKKNGTKTVPQGYYLIVRKTVPLGVLFWYHIAKRVLFSTQFLPKNGASVVLKQYPFYKRGTVF